ncbi:MAG: F0F1 ATP synthase subunit delta [Gammaproteobacteria bacterium]|jgi:F-type H+-transporting ATPase subunit delta|nr:F0F1 ATP synthase subunit delta [Gammaproteobacteria bacterium]
MEERTTIARPYAEAAFAQASREGAVEQWLGAVELLATIVKEPAVSERLAHPRFSNEQLSELVLAVGAGVDEELFNGTRENFIKVLLENRRLGYAPEISELFQWLKREDEKQIDVEVISAYPLDGPAEVAIAAVVKERLGKEVLITTLVDKSLFGGVVVRAGDQVIDLSLRGKMDQLSSLMQS